MQLLAGLLLLPLALAHFRLACPPARSLQTGIKSGPCGGDPATEPFTLVRPPDPIDRAAPH